MAVNVLKYLCVTFLLLLCFSTCVCVCVCFTTKSAAIGAGLREIFYFILFYGKLLSEMRTTALGLMYKIHDPI